MNAYMRMRRFVLKAALKVGIPAGALIGVFFLFHSVGLPEPISALAQLSRDSQTSVVEASAELPVISPDRAPAAVKSAKRQARALATVRRRAARVRATRPSPVPRFARARMPSALPALPARRARGRLKGDPVPRPRRRQDPGSVRSGAPSTPRRVPTPKPITSPAPLPPSPPPLQPSPPPPSAPAPQPPPPPIIELPPVPPILREPELPPLPDPLAPPSHPVLPAASPGQSLFPAPSKRP